MTEELLLNITHAHDMITTNEILDCIILFIDHTDHHIDTILVLDRDHVLIQETIILQDKSLHLDLLQDQEILDILDPARTLIQGTKVIQ